MYRKSSPESPNSPDELGEFDIYGKTPPRTKILRKNREKRQREKTIGSVVSPRTPKKAPLNRRNTVCAVYDDLIQKFETKTDLDTASTKKSKRQLKLLRGSERDLKLDLAPPKNHPEGGQSMDSQIAQSQPSWHIGNHKRFMCLSWRTTACPKFKHSNRNEGTPGKFIHEQNEVTDHSNGTAEEINNRVEFYESLACLVKSGSIKEKQNLCPADMFKRNISHAECRWQNELNDLIWLELQAFHANKTCTEADEYLCTKRGTVGILLNDIMSYQFQRHPSTLLTQNSDSGVEEDCEGCLSIHCSACLEAQNEALKEIEDISRRLDAAEALFPSSKAFGEVYPLYNSPEFTSRVKAISLWYNMTKIQRLKLNILGRFLHFLHLHQSQWPSGGAGGGSPSDSNNSSASSANDYPNDAKTDSYFDYFNIAPLQALTKKDGVSPYRLYIENILKTRALNKSLNFLEMLHTNVLKKARITLEKPEDMSIFDKQICETEEEELMRFGAWSPEAKALNLPSYRTTFLFLGSVPLEVIHEFLRLRLEQKPENPSLLSIRQLMRELKEGLTTATKQRSRIDKYIKSACKGLNECSITYQKKLKEFDNCLKDVFKDYLDYLENWALLNHASFQKNLLEAEWAFSTSVVTFIPDGRQLLQHKFCSILASIFKSIGERFIDNIDILIRSIPNCSNVPHDEELKHNLFAICRELQTVFTEEREMSIKTVSFCKKIKNESLHCYSNQMLKESVVAFKCIIPKAIAKVQKIFDHECFKSLDETEKKSFESRIREILMQGYKFGFEFYQEMTDGEPDARREKLIKSMVQFATLWMRFAVERCDRGRGMRPRWAYQGLDFLLTVCEPKNTRFLTEEEFNYLKMNMEMCIKHVIGTSAPSTPDSGFFSISPRSSITKSRGTSPSPRPTYKSQRSSASHSRKTSSDKTASPMEQVDTPFFDHTTRNGSRGGSLSDVTSVLRQTHLERTREAIDTLENDLNLKLRKQRLIGKVIECEGGACKSTFRQRHVNFTWQRGIKIGQGRFGKVYTAVNNATGEMMAVKEIALQHNDNLTIKRVAEEMKILEGIVHENLVKYYGVEVHRDEMLLFMEYCAEGTLENLVAGTESGLPELLIRRFTYQLVSGVACMHSHGIVHRDIKTANIFLTDEGNCLKIGDFGCAAKIKFHSTMLGELKGFVGTQAYMAPEVFTKNMAEGHGRAADIWSVGCVVVEMSSGKRPWAQFDSNYQIMFKVGMGQSPDPPDDMIDEGLDFLELCFRFDPKERATAHELLDHNFVKAGDIVD